MRVIKRDGHTVCGLYAVGRLMYVMRHAEHISAFHLAINSDPVGFDYLTAVKMGLWTSDL